MPFLSPIYAFLSTFLSFAILSIGALAVLNFGLGWDLDFPDAAPILALFGAVLAVPLTLGVVASLLRPGWNRGILAALLCLHLLPVCIYTWLGAGAPDSYLEGSEMDRSMAWAMAVPFVLALLLNPAWFWWFRRRDV